ncbi:MAG: DUF6444 domain-containing protein [Cyanobacteriota bacterium]
MSTPPAGIPAAVWSLWPAAARQLILAQQEEIQVLGRENDELRVQRTALATELASLRERIGRRSRNSSKPPSSNGPGFKAARAAQGQWPQAWRPARPPWIRARSAAARCGMERIQPPCGIR